VHELFVWIQKDLFAASPKLNQLQDLARVVQGGGTSSFTSTAFHNRVAQLYQEGAGLVVAANLERLIERAKSARTGNENAAKRENALQQLGILNLKYFVLDQKNSAGKTHTQATVSFNEAQHGIPSWLAAPGPMGSLEYISPDANVVAGFVVKDPVKLVDDLLGVIETVSPDLRKNLDKQQADRGLDIRKDIAAPLGGEFAFAIDGPILPTPSWKMVFEVNDSEHLQQTLERIVSEINKEAAKFGKNGLVWDRAEIDGRNYYTLKSADFSVEVNYTYVNGYVSWVQAARWLSVRCVRSRQATRCCAHRVSPPACHLTATQTFRRSSITTWRRCSAIRGTHSQLREPSAPGTARGDQDHGCRHAANSRLRLRAGRQHNFRS